MTNEQEIKEMFENAVHIGHRTHKWDPRMKKYIYGERNGIHIINLEQTARCLAKALEFLAKLNSEGKTVLFVSTKPQSIKFLEELAKSCKMPYVVGKWIAGLLTNFGTLKSRIKYLTDLKEQKELGGFSKYTKKEAAKLTKVIEKLQIALGGVEGMNAKPDAVFVLDSVRDHIVVEEARKLKIPVVGIVDTNADPTALTYPIPANDDAIKSIIYLLGRVKEILLKGPAKRAEAK